MEAEDNAFGSRTILDLATAEELEENNILLWKVIIVQTIKVQSKIPNVVISNKNCLHIQGKGATENDKVMALKAKREAEGNNRQDLIDEPNEVC